MTNYAVANLEPTVSSIRNNHGHTKRTGKWCSRKLPCIVNKTDWASASSMELRNRMCARCPKTTDINCNKQSTSNSHAPNFLPQISEQVCSPKSHANESKSKHTAESDSPRFPNKHPKLEIAHLSWLASLREILVDTGILQIPLFESFAGSNNLLANCNNNQSKSRLMRGESKAKSQEWSARASTLKNYVTERKEFRATRSTVLEATCKFNAGHVVVSCGSWSARVFTFSMWVRK